jgi:hypothetical protein
MSQLGGQTDAAFWPLQPHSDPSATGQFGFSVTEKVPINLVVYPKMAYHSPYSIDLSKSPKSIYDGLPPFSTITSPAPDRSASADRRANRNPAGGCDRWTESGHL